MRSMLNGRPWNRFYNSAPGSTPEGVTPESQTIEVSLGTKGHPAALMPPLRSGSKLLAALTRSQSDGQALSPDKVCVWLRLWSGTAISPKTTRSTNGKALSPQGRATGKRFWSAPAARDVISISTRRRGVSPRLPAQKLASVQGIFTISLNRTM